MPEASSILYLSIFLLAGISVWLSVLAFFPDKWKKIAKKEYDFHCRTGWVPEKAARWQHGFSLGKGLKITLILMWCSILGCLIGLWRNPGL